MPTSNDRVDREATKKVMSEIQKMTGRREQKSECSDGETCPFDQAVSQIIKGAQQMKTAVSGDLDNQTYSDPAEPFARITDGAFCLRMAYQIWQDVYNREQQERAERLMRQQMSQYGSMLRPGYGPNRTALLGGRKSMNRAPELEGAAPPDVSREAALSIGKSTLQSILNVLAEAGMPPDEMDQFARQYREQCTPKQPTQERQPADPKDWGQLPNNLKEKSES